LFGQLFKGDKMSNYTGAASGAISGASAGGSIAGVPGAIFGGLFGGVSGLFGGKKKRARKVSTLDKNQQEINNQQFQALQGEGPLADLYNYDPEAANRVFDETIANPAYRKYKEDLAPNITGQFRKEGLMNSSYAGDALTKMARDIQESLDSQRKSYQYGQQKDAQNAKRQAVNQFQGQQNFAYDTSAGSQSGFDIDKVLESIPPEAITQLKDYFSKKKPGTGGV
jgi:hypothetical protein